MAGSTSLPSVVAVFPALSCPGGLRATTNARVFCWTPSFTRLRSHVVCRHNGVRILWGGLLSTGLVQCRAETDDGGSSNGVVRALEETTEASPKSRGRVKKPVEEVPVSDGAESDFDQRTILVSSRRKSTSARGRKKKVVVEVNDAPSLVEKQVIDTTEVLQQRVEKTKEVSTSNADEDLSSEDSSPDATAKPATRRRARNSTKRGKAEKPESNTISNPLQIEQTVESTHSNVESPGDSESGKKKPSVRRKKKTTIAVDQPVARTEDVEDTSVDSRNLKSPTTTEDTSLSSSSIDQQEHIQGDRLGISEEQSSETSDSGVEPERSNNKSVRPRKKRGKAADNVRLSGDEELHIRVQETALSSLNGSSVEIPVRLVERGVAISEEIANEGQGTGLIPAESRAEPDIHNSDVKVKKKRQRKARKKPAAVVTDPDEEKAAVAESVLLDDTTGSDSQFNSEEVVESQEEEAVSNSDDGDSVVHTPGSEESPPPKTRTRRRRRQGDAINKQVSEGANSESVAAPMSNINGAAVDTSQTGTLWNGTDGGVESTSRIQFPAPTWGPQWWDEIQSKSQATISFQDIAERREGFQTRSKVLQEPMPKGGEIIDIQEPAEKRPAEVIESAEQRIELTEANRDSDVLNNRGDSVIRQREGLKKSGRRIAKLHPAQKAPPQESHDEWLKKKMLSLGKPTEEPWLLESMITLEAKQELSTNEASATTNEEPRRVVSDPLRQQDPGDLKKEPEVEVEILINTSECTMQRMAILENKKLVEFSIEPVNTKVQVGNIYLGRVKQLLPGMSGVFVDIGGSRLALLDIARNQYPYTFPPVYTPEDNGAYNGADNRASSLEDNEDLEEENDYVEEEDDEDEDEEGHEELVVAHEVEDFDDLQEEKSEEVEGGLKAWRPHKQGSPITVNFGRKFSKWRNVGEGMPIIVQVKKEAMGKKGPRLTAFPTLAGRFWVLIPRGNAVGVSARITGPERRRLKLLAQSLRPQDLGITVRTEAIGHEQEELERDLIRLIDTWKEITEKAASAALAVERGEEAAVPVLLHREMGQTLTIIRDLFTEKISRLVVDSSQSYQEVINYLQEVAPHLMSRVVLYSGKVPIFDKFNVEVDLDRFSSERVKLPNGGYLVMQETEALVSVDVNGGTGMLGHSTRQREAILEVNLAAAKQIASEIRLRDIGGIIVVDFIDMDYSEDERLVHEEMRKAIQRDRSKVSISEISEFGLMEMTRKRVRSSVTLTMHSSCSTCKGTGRVEALETTLSKIERAIWRLLAEHPEMEERSSDASTWPQILLRVEPPMLEFLKSWKKKRIVQLGHSLKVWITLKPGMELGRGQFEVTHRGNKKGASGGGSGSHGSQKSSLQQEKAVSAPVLGKRVWPKRKRHFA